MAFVLILIGCNESEEIKNTPSKPYDQQLNFSLKNASETGIDFANELEEIFDEEFTLSDYEYFYNGAGVAIGDLNNDGLADIYFSGNMVDDRLYLNQGGLKFKDISESSGIWIDRAHWSTGANMVDINKDGLLDIYVAQAGPYKNAEERANLLFINNGDLTFSEKASEYGLDDKGISIQSSFFDYDKDGDLDCYVSNESPLSKVFFESLYLLNQEGKDLDQHSGHLYRNEGNGKFKKVTEEAGLLQLGFGLGAVAGDLNDDGWTDLYIANDYSIPDFMYINQKDGTFKDEIKERTKQIAYFSMGADVNDFNNDGYPDIANLDMATTDHVRGKTAMVSMDVPKFRRMTERLGYQVAYMYNALQLNTGNNEFVNIAHLAGVAQTEWSWATLLLDMDNDGWKDMFVSNGYFKNTMSRDEMIDISRNIKKQDVSNEEKQKLLFEGYKNLPSIHVPNEFYHNKKDLSFDKQNPFTVEQLPTFSNGAAYADLDNDGDLDLVINNINQEASLLENQSKGNHYLQITLKSEKPIENSKVYLVYRDGSLQYQELIPSRGYQSSMDRLIHFGISNQDADQVDFVEVQWPDGSISRIDTLQIDSRMIVKKERSKTMAQSGIPKKNLTFFKEVDPEAFGLDYIHIENSYDDFRKETLLPQKQSTLGPKIEVADLNNDDLEDLIIPGASGQASVIFYQNEEGKFDKYSLENIVDVEKEHVYAHCFDADGDGDVDLYLVAGGNEFPFNDKRYSDDLLLNDGQGFQTSAILSKNVSNSIAVSSDYDGDGDMDLFVGGRLKPQHYPLADKSFILENNGGHFNVAFEFELGMVNDALWADADQDGKKELVVVGEWEAPKIMDFNGSEFTVRDLSDEGIPKGWYYSVESMDHDKDGDLDFVLGNLGKNTKFSASQKKPFMVYAGDFDQNGTHDCVLSKKYNGKLVPTRGKECSSQQMPFIKEKFPTFNSFANAELQEILGDEMENAVVKKTTSFSSGILVNNEGKFEFKPFPNPCQIAPILDILLSDVDKDNDIEIIAAGNIYNTEVETPRYDAGSGLIIDISENKLQGAFFHATGLYLPGNVKSIQRIKIGSQNYLIAGNNSGELQLFLSNE